MYTIDFSVILQAKELLLQGLMITLRVSILSSIFAFILGVFVAYLRDLPNHFAKIITNIYVEAARNVPLLIQLYIIYKVYPHFGLSFSPINCGIIALSLYTGAYIAEVLRSGMNSIAKQQPQASYALGLNYFQTFFLITFPQAIRIVIPALGSQFINLIKNSSLVSFIAVVDIFYVIYKGAADDFRIYEFFLVGALMYMVLSGFVALITNILEKKLKVYGREARV
ncbi:MAG: amino acid ABC transporter permease [bacterium]